MSVPAAIADDLAAVPRWIGWKLDNETKVPKDPNRRENASSTNPATWGTHEAALALAARSRLAGVGIVFNGDGLGGVDLDACRKPDTGEIAEWAMQLVLDFSSYTEISPSGTGLKIYARGAPASLPANKISIEGEKIGDKSPQIEAYVTGRWFAVTGQHLDCTPDEIVEAPEAWERLAYRLRQTKAGKAKAEPVALPTLTSTPEQLAERLAFVISPDAELGRLWAEGHKESGDTSASAKDAALVARLHRAGADHELISYAFFAFQHGQVAAGKLKGRRAGRRLADLLANFAGDREDEEDFDRWLDDLHQNDRGDFRDIIHNVTVILRKDDRFKGRLRYNEMLEAVEAMQLPWRKGGWEPWSDADDLYLAQWCQQRHVYVKPTTCAAAVQLVARDLKCHPLRERLEATRWDGTERVEQWLATYLGAADTPYTRAIGCAWLVSAIARVFQPGCKADHCLILEGPQGAGKSTAAATIALEEEWFTDEIAQIGSKDCGQDLVGKWVIELGELSALNRSAIESTKAFLSRRSDHYRPSYGRRSQDFPRQCVFIGSTNADSYLADETGGRRFWPVKIGRIDIAKLRADRDQLWAEALAAYRAGAKWWLDKAIEQDAREQQDNRRIVDPWEDLVLDWARLQAGPVTVGEVMTTALGMDADRRDQHASNRIARLFKASGWERKRDSDAGRKWRYHPPIITTTPEPELVEASRTADAFTRAGMRSVPVDTPVVPVGAAPTGTDKPLENKPCPSVPVCPSSSLTHVRRCAQSVAHTGSDANLNFMKPLGRTGTTGTEPRWDDLNRWRPELSRTQNNLAARKQVVSRWAMAAGGMPDGFGYILLPDLPKGLAANELRRLIVDVGLSRPANAAALCSGIDLSNPAPGMAS